MTPLLGGPVDRSDLSLSHGEGAISWSPLPRLEPPEQPGSGHDARSNTPLLANGDGRPLQTRQLSALQAKLAEATRVAEAARVAKQKEGAAKAEAARVAAARQKAKEAKAVKAKAAADAKAKAVSAAGSPTVPARARAYR